MKVNLKNILGLAALGLTLLANTAPTWAGMAIRPGVSIRKTPPLSASGSMVGARYSADSKQFIGCRLYASPYQIAQCVAQDRAGNSLVCTTDDPGKIQRLQRMTDSSWILFNPNPTTGACDYLDIFNYSYTLR